MSGAARRVAGKRFKTLVNTLHVFDFYAFFSVSASHHPDTMALRRAFHGRARQVLHKVIHRLWMAIGGWRTRAPVASRLAPTAARALECRVLAESGACEFRVKRASPAVRHAASVVVR
jgi:hypothetical protein